MARYEFFSVDASGLRQGLTTLKELIQRRGGPLDQAMQEAGLRVYETLLRRLGEFETAKGGHAQAFADAIAPTFHRIEEGGRLQALEVRVGSLEVLRGPEFQLERKWDPAMKAVQRGFTRPISPRRSLADELTDEGEAAFNRLQFLPVKPPGRQRRGAYQPETKVVLWWRLFNEGVDIHYIYSGKQIAGVEDAPYLAPKGAAQAGFPPLLRLTHPGIRARRFIARTLADVEADRVAFRSGVAQAMNRILKAAALVVRRHPKGGGPARVVAGL